MKLSKNSWLLISINTIHTIVNLFYSTFLVAYFLNITDNNIIPTSLFYIFTYAIMLIIFPAIGPLIKKGKKLFFYKLSFLTSFTLLLMIIYLKDDVINHLGVLGIILGLERIFYWFPQNILISEIANGNQLIKFTGYSMFFSGFAKIIMPLTLGYLITINTFINTSVIVLILTSIQFVLSNFLKETQLKLKKFNIKALWVLATKRERIKISLKVEALKGIVIDITDMLIVLYVIYMFKTNLNLGILTSIFAICTVSVDFILGSRCRYKYFKPILFIASILIFSATAYFVLDTSKFSFILYNIVFASAGEALKTITEINMYKISQDKSITVHYRAEYLALREIVLNLGRIFGFGLIILFAIFDNGQILKYLILGLSIILAYVGHLSIILSQKIIEKNISISC